MNAQSLRGPIEQYEGQIASLEERLASAHLVYTQMANGKAMSPQIRARYDAHVNEVLEYLEYLRSINPYYDDIEY